MKQSVWHAVAAVLGEAAGRQVLSCLFSKLLFFKAAAHDNKQLAWRCAISLLILVQILKTLF